LLSFRHSIAEMIRGMISNGMSFSVPSFDPYTAKVMPSRRKIASASDAMNPMASGGCSFSH
jgi:hypothetical protein